MSPQPPPLSGEPAGVWAAVWHPVPGGRVSQATVGLSISRTSRLRLGRDSASSEQHCVAPSAPRTPEDTVGVSCSLVGLRPHGSGPRPSGDGELGLAASFRGQRIQRAPSTSDTGPLLGPHTASTVLYHPGLWLSPRKKEGLGLDWGLSLGHGPVAGHLVEPLGPPQNMVFTGINYTSLERQPVMPKYSYQNMK